MKLLATEEIDARLAALPGWRRTGDALERTFEQGNFAGALRLVNAVGVAADELYHHPDVAISWGTVVFTLSTHSAGGVTELDFALAARIDQLAGSG
jgi:4a-hydroxytetrahydrobiopterin dehydratase